jgi:hypothetical protein
MADAVPAHQARHPDLIRSPTPVLVHPWEGLPARYLPEQMR